MIINDWYLRNYSSQLRAFLDLIIFIKFQTHKKSTLLMISVCLVANLELRLAHIAQKEDRTKVKDCLGGLASLMITCI